MKLVSWNVNGLRACINKGFNDFFTATAADIVCLQETKMQRGQAEEDLPPSTSWADAPPLQISPRLREYGEAAPRGALSRVRDRSAERALMAQQLAEESRQVDAARQRLASGRATRLSELGDLDTHAFGLFLSLLGEALAEQSSPEQTVERQTGDGLLQIRMEPLDGDSQVRI